MKCLCTALASVALVAPFSWPEETRAELLQSTTAAEERSVRAQNSQSLARKLYSSRRDRIVRFDTERLQIDKPERMTLFEDTKVNIQMTKRMEPNDGFSVWEGYVVPELAYEIKNSDGWKLEGDKAEEAYRRQHAVKLTTMAWDLNTRTGEVTPTKGFAQLVFTESASEAEARKRQYYKENPHIQRKAFTTVQGTVRALVTEQDSPRIATFRIDSLEENRDLHVVMEVDPSRTGIRTIDAVPGEDPPDNPRFEEYLREVESAEKQQADSPKGGE